MKTNAHYLSILYLLGILFGVLDGCNYTFIEHKCIVDIYCTFPFESFESSLLENHGECVPDRVYRNHILPISLKYKIKSMDILFQDGYDLYKNIISIDLSGNDYDILPSINYELPFLKFLNASNNKLFVANLFNDYNLDSLEEIDFSHNLITNIEVNDNYYVFRKLVNISLSYNNLHDISKATFKSFSDLKHLDLSYNHIANISLFTFEGLTKLSVLRLSYNSLNDINWSLFRFHELQELYLNNNNIKTVLVRDFETVQKLKILDLSHNSIVYMEENIFKAVPLLKQINLSHNLLTNISKSIFIDNLYLESVYLSNNKLIELPTDLFKGKNILAFSIEHNYLGGILKRGMFEGLKLCGILDVSNQEFTFIEDYAFFGLEKLTGLLLNNNLIETVSNKSFKTLKKLKLLDLSYNRITDIDFEKEDLESLESLLLRGNNIMQIKVNQLHSLYRLELLDLSRNNISRIESKSFQALSNINNFQISKNPLTGELESNTFGGLHQVPMLDLSSTYLSVVQNSSLNGMLQLNELNISHSNISQVQYNAFLNTGNIEILDLSHNEIKYFYVNTTHLRKLNQLMLNNNLIKSLPSDFLAGMNYLNKICLSYNSITFISDDTFNDQSDLNYIDLSFNLNLYIKSSLFREVKKLDTLILSNTLSNITFNDFGYIPVTKLEIAYSNISNLNNLNLNKLRKIVFIQLSHNNLSQLEVGSFSNLCNVNEIDISFNKISVIQPGVFKDNFLLKKLNISHNALTEIGYGILRGLAHLNILDVSFNFIRTIEAERFYEAESLTELIIDHNKINNISLEVLSGTNLSVLSIGDNPIPCKMLSNLVKYKDPKLSITAARYVDTMEHNSYGITCNIMDYQSKVSSVPHTENFNDNLLFDIRDILSDINSKQLGENVEKSKTPNFTRLESLHEDTMKEVTNLNNFMSKAYDESKTTNSLLERILKTIVSINSLNRSIPIPIKDNVTSDRVLNYISKLRQDMFDQMTIGKEEIRAEVDSKLSILSKRIDSATTIVPHLNTEKLLLSSEESKSTLFVETCVALILFILKHLLIIANDLAELARRSWSS
ncbi:unnamed protein product, partial [Brenthis ino]